MNQSRVSTFSDPYDYEAAVRAVSAEVIVKAKGDFSAELVKVDLDRLWMQTGAESLGRIARLSISPARAPIGFLGGRDQAPMLHAGVEVSGEDIIVYGAGTMDLQKTTGECHWASMSLSHPDLAEAGRLLAGQDLECGGDTYILRPDGRSLERLRAIHSAAGQLAKVAPSVLTNPEAAKALGEELVRAMIACLTGRAPVEIRSCAGKRARVITRFEELLSSKKHEPVYLAEICATTGVSATTLRACCHEHLGMGPVRYLWLRRMHLARRALLRAGAAATVTSIATAFGFWELGRFAVEYRILFGETPSASLRRSKGEASDQESEVPELPNC